MSRGLHFVARGSTSYPNTWISLLAVRRDLALASKINIGLTFERVGPTLRSHNG